MEQITFFATSSFMYCNHQGNNWEYSVTVKTLHWRRHLATQQRRPRKLGLSLSCNAAWYRKNGVINIAVNATLDEDNTVVDPNQFKIQSIKEVNSSTLKVRESSNKSR